VTDELRVIIELGKNGRRVVAGATDWPGLDRWGKTEEGALETLGGYAERYAPIAGAVGRRDELMRAARTPVVIERIPASSSADYWGIAHVPARVEQEVLSEDDLERRLALLEACWSFFDEAAARVSADLRPGSRGGGRTREEIIRHVHANEPEQFTRKVEVRTAKDVVLSEDGRAAHRRQTLDAIRSYNGEGRRARTWPIQFLVRRIAHHVMDHAWELEDRDLTAET
jgi:hypothetical protein